MQRPISILIKDENSYIPGFSPLLNAKLQDDSRQYLHVLNITKVYTCNRLIITRRFTNKSFYII